MYIILSKELQKILLTAFSDSLEITLDPVINIMSLNATEYILFYFKNLQYDYKVTYSGFYLTHGYLGIDVLETEFSVTIL